MLLTPSTPWSGRRLALRATESLVWALTWPAILCLPLLTPLESSPLQATTRWIDRRQAWGDGLSAPPSRCLHRPAAFLAVDVLLGALSTVIWALIGFGVATAWSMVLGAVTGGSVPLLDDAPPGSVTWKVVAWSVLPGLVLLFLALSGLAGAGALSRQARHAFGLPGADELAREVDELHSTLQAVVRAVDAERRRIERDLHDGVQQRVVALSLVLARAERTPDGPEHDDLQRRAREEVQAIHSDLREVSWRLYPAMLARVGLAEALEALCDRTTVPTSLSLPSEPGPRPDPSVEIAAFFSASEAVSNVLKHAGASRIEVCMSRREELLTVTVSDDGRGGADPRGQGLSGVASRVAACGGRLHVTSPRGGPTTVEASFPCA